VAAERYEIVVLVRLVAAGDGSIWKNGIGRIKWQAKRKFNAGRGVILATSCGEARGKVEKMESGRHFLSERELSTLKAGRWKSRNSYHQ
jgi:hypothetical protein